MWEGEGGGTFASIYTIYISFVVRMNRCICRPWANLPRISTKQSIRIRKFNLCDTSILFIQFESVEAITQTSSDSAPLE